MSERREDPRTTDPMALLGRCLGGRWQLQSCVSEGSFCSVYRAIDLELPDTSVAIKCFLAFRDTPPAQRPSLLESFRDVEDRMRRLSAATGYVPTMLGCDGFELADDDESAWFPFVALEWIEGTSLLDILLDETERGQAPRALEDCVRALTGPALALEAAHDLGIVHLDIKPEHLLVCGHELADSVDIKVLDFGVTRLVTGIGEDAGERERPRISAITPEYAAPELYDRAYGDIGPQTDVFAFALVLLEMMRGGRSVLGEQLEFDKAGVAEMRRRATDRLRRPTPRRLGIQVAPDVEAVFARALAVDPKRRQPNMGAFRQLLGDAIERSRATPDIDVSPPVPNASPVDPFRSRTPTVAMSEVARDPTPIVEPSTSAGPPPEETVTSTRPSAIEGHTRDGEPVEVEFVTESTPTMDIAHDQDAPNEEAVRDSSTDDDAAGEFVVGERAMARVRIDPNYAELLTNDPSREGLERHYGELSPMQKLGEFSRKHPKTAIGAVAASMLVALTGNWLLDSGVPEDGSVAQAAIIDPDAVSTPTSTNDASPTPREPQPPEDPPAVAVPAEPACPSGMVMIDAGKFYMGSDSDHRALRAANPAHQVNVERFCLDVHEVTVREYQACSKIGECKRAHRASSWPRGSKDVDDWKHAQEVHSPLCNESAADTRGDHPINCVSHRQAKSYCEYIGKRLPTEAEWEYAARGSDGRTFPWGDAEPDATRVNACGSECKAWRATNELPVGATMYESSDGYPGTAPVGSFAAGTTQFGLMDIVGNVFEWTADPYRPYPQPKSKSRSRRKTAKPDPRWGAKYVIRGGAFNSTFPQWSDPAMRYGMAERAHTHAIGFRCASEPSRPGLLPSSGADTE